MVKLFLGVRPKPCATIAARGLAPLARGDIAPETRQIRYPGTPK